MNRFFLFILFAIVINSCTGVDDTGKHLFILSGQSNMAGLQLNESFTPTIESFYGKTNVVIVKDAHSGQPIRRWYKRWKPVSGDDPEATGDLYDTLMTKVYAAIENVRIKTVTFIWMQGERDAREKHGEVYAASLKGLLNQLRDDLGHEDIFFIIGRLSDFDMDNSTYPHWTMVRDVQIEVAEEYDYGAWIDTDDLNSGTNRQGTEINDDLHYSEEGYVELGRRFADTAIALITNKSK